MSVLLLKLAGPLQSWGAASRFSRRETRREPTRSGILGLLAAAQGRRRTDPIEDLAALRFGVRIEQPGRLVTDFQTARSLDGRRTMPLSTRHYLADAVFLAAVEGEDAMVEGLVEALRRPTFPLFLGRRSCPPAGPLVEALRSGSLVEVLRAEEWRAAAWWRRQERDARVDLEIVRDATDDDADVEVVRDEPVSFDPRRREYAWRRVAREWVTVDNPDHPGNGSVPIHHDPVGLLEEV